MKSNESAIARGRAVTLEMLSSAVPSELERILDLGLSQDSFSNSLERSAEIPVRSSSLPRCEHFGNSPGLSGLKPNLFLNSELTSREISIATAMGLFEMARSIYLDRVTGADPGDLDVWIGAGLPATVRTVSPHFIEAYGNDRTMLRIDMASTPAALCSFRSLRKLVLLDG